MISIADAAADPRTVVIHLCYTLITNRAMMRSRRLRLATNIAHSIGNEASKVIGFVAVAKLQKKCPINSFLSFAYVLIYLRVKQAFSKSIQTILCLIILNQCQVSIGMRIKPLIFHINIICLFREINMAI